MAGRDRLAGLDARITQDVTMTEPVDTKDHEAYNLELYKRLREESARYLEKIPGIWLQKFLFAGTVLAFVITKSTESPTLVARSFDIIVIGFLCVPVLAILLDVKILEYSLHARAISEFIESQFKDAGNVVAWEAALWGGGPDVAVAGLTRYRSAATVTVTLISTALLIGLSGAVVGILTHNMRIIMLVTVVGAVAYVLIGLWAAVVIWPRLLSRTKHTPGR